MKTRLGKLKRKLAGRIRRAFGLQPRYTLQDLIDGLEPGNMPGETNWGPPVGKEIL